MVIVLLDKSYLLLQDATRTESGRKQAQHHVSTQHARQLSSSDSSSSRPPVSTQHARQVSSSDSSSSRPPIFFFGFFFIRNWQHVHLTCLMFQWRYFAHVYLINRISNNSNRHVNSISELHMRPDFRTLTYWNSKCPIDLRLSGHLTYCFAVETVTFTVIFTCSWTLCPIPFKCPGHCDLLRKKTVWSSV